MEPSPSKDSSKTRWHGGKRKRALSDPGDERSSIAKSTPLEPPKERLGGGGNIDDSIGHMNPNFLADHVMKKVKRSFRDLSAAELETRYVSPRIFHDTSDLEMPRHLDHLPSFLEHLCHKGESLSTSSGTTGSPHTLVVAASGLRAADVVRFDTIPSLLHSG